MRDVLEMTIPQCEQLVEGISENNKVDGSTKTRVIEGSDVVKFLKQGNGKL